MFVVDKLYDFEIWIRVFALCMIGSPHVSNDRLQSNACICVCLLVPFFV